MSGCETCILRDECTVQDYYFKTDQNPEEGFPELMKEIELLGREACEICVRNENCTNPDKCRQSWDDLLRRREGLRRGAACISKLLKRRSGWQWIADRANTIGSDQVGK